MSKKGKIVKFSQYYAKLTQDLVPTIRKKGTIKVGDIVRFEVHKSPYAFARCVYRFKTRLDAIPTPLLCYDTGQKTRSASIAKIRSFYMEVTLVEPIYFYLYVILKRLQTTLV